MSRSRGSAASVLIFVVVLSGCSSRSVTAFCDELDESMAAMAESSQELAETEDPLLGFLGAFGTLGDMQRALERLADVAPSEIQQDMEIVRDTVDDQLDLGEAASNPLGALISGLGQGLMNQRSFQRVDDFALDNCGQPVFGP